MALVTLAKLAAEIGVTPSRVYQMKADGMLDAALVKSNGRKKPLVDLQKGIDLYKKNSHPMFIKGAPGNPAKKTATKKGKPVKAAKPTRAKASASGKPRKAVSYTDSRAQVEAYKAKEKKLEFEIKQGKWIEKAQVKKELYTAGRICRDTLLAIPARLAAQVAAESNEKKCFKLLHTEIKQALVELARQLRGIG